MASNSDYARGKEIVTAQGLYILEAPSGKAILVNFVGKGDTWLPISQMAKDVEIPDASNSNCIVFIPRWLAEKNNLDYEDYEMELNEEGELDEKDWEDKDSYTKMMSHDGGRD